MRMFKRMLWLGLVCVTGLYIAGAVRAEGLMAQGAGFSAKGSIAASERVTLFAPMGGQLDDFSWEVGDWAEAGALAVLIKPATVYAANDGLITALRAQSGDQAAAVAAQYGALCYIERDDVWHVNGSMASGYNDPDNRDVRVGDVLRVQHGSGDGKVRGEGTVVFKAGDNFVLEMARGDFDIEDSVKVYLGTSKDNANKDQVGSGRVARVDPLPVLGEGVVASALVSEGDRVVRGQPLFILDGAQARYGADAPVYPEVRFSRDGVIGEVWAAPGQFVQQGQPVMTLLPMDALEAVLEVDELDIARVRVGDRVRVGVDAFYEERVGTVLEICPLGVAVLDTTKFVVTVALDSSDDLLIGMRVTGHWD